MIFENYSVVGITWHSFNIVFREANYGIYISGEFPISSIIVFMPVFNKLKKVFDYEYRNGRIWL